MAAYHSSIWHWMVIMLLSSEKSHLSSMYSFEMYYKLLYNSTIHYYTIQCNTLLYNTVQYIIIQYSTVQYYTIQYSTIHYHTIQYNTMWKNNKQYDKYHTPGCIFIRKPHYRYAYITETELLKCLNNNIKHPDLNVHVTCKESFSPT